MVDQKHKTRENRSRRRLERMGYVLQKSHRRDPRAFDYGLYRIIDTDTNGLAAGGGSTGYNMDLDEVEAWIESD